MGSPFWGIVYLGKLLCVSSSKASRMGDVERTFRRAIRSSGSLCHSLSVILPSFTRPISRRKFAMFFCIASMPRTERFFALRDIFLNGHIGVAKHNGLRLAALTCQNLEFFTSVSGFTFLNTAGLVYLHIKRVLVWKSC